MKYSYNNRLIVESYKSDRALRSDVKGGFARPEQKVAIKGLKLLVHANLVIGTTNIVANPGSTVFIKEEYLHSQPWAQKNYKADGIEGEFLIVDLVNVEFIDYES